MTQNETIKKASIYVFLSFAGAIMAASFNNCSGQDMRPAVAPDAIVSKLPVEEIQILQAPLGEADPILCEVKSFACMQRIKQTELAPANEPEAYCVSEDECLLVYREDYDSSLVQSSCENCETTQESEIETSEEFYCFNESIRERLGIEVRTYAPSLVEAVSQAVNLCKMQLEL